LLKRPEISYLHSFLIATFWWLFWFFIQFLAYHRIGGFWYYALVEAFISTILLGLAGLVIANTYRYYSPVVKNYYLLVAYVIILHLITIRSSYLFFTYFYVDDPAYLE